MDIKPNSERSQLNSLFLSHIPNYTITILRTCNRWITYQIKTDPIKPRIWFYPVELRSKSRTQRVATTYNLTASMLLVTVIDQHRTLDPKIDFALSLYQCFSFLIIFDFRVRIPKVSVQSLVDRSASLLSQGQLGPARET